MLATPKLNWSGQIRKNLLAKQEQPTPPQYTDSVAFGAMPAPHMLTCKYSPDSGWQDAEIKAFGPISLMPDSVAFHYGQQIFEGLKAYRATDDQVFLFRPDMNAKRFYRSAVRLGMAPVPEEMFVKCVRALVEVEKAWVLPEPWSLYIRPFLIPLDRGVSLRASKTYQFTVIVCPVNAYYSSPGGIKVLIERNLVRAAPGGVGEAKCGGNYAASLYPMSQAHAAHAEQVLWLDAISHEYVEEVGAMNIMFAYGNKIITPRLTGSILPGVTRDSVLKLAPTLGFEIEEKRIAISQVISDIESGLMTECFGCGTAAVISPVNQFIDGSNSYTVKQPPDAKVAATLKKTLVSLQNGSLPDSMGWRVQV